MLFDTTEVESTDGALSTCRTSEPAFSLHSLPAVRVDERIGDPTPSVHRQVTISRMTRERWAQIGITVEFLIVIRTLSEFFRLRHVLGANFSTAVATPYVTGALIAACSCWSGVILYFFRRYTVSAWIALATVIVLLVYKIAVIGF
jgi:hypothetical protein